MHLIVCHLNDEDILLVKSQVCIPEELHLLIYSQGGDDQGNRDEELKNGCHCPESGFACYNALISLQHLDGLKSRQKEGRIETGDETCG